jgi:hypothetical protein
MISNSRAEQEQQKLFKKLVLSGSDSCKKKEFKIRENL